VGHHTPTSFPGLSLETRFTVDRTGIRRRTVFYRKKCEIQATEGSPLYGERGGGGGVGELEVFIG